MTATNPSTLGTNAPAFMQPVIADAALPLATQPVASPVAQPVTSTPEPIMTSPAGPQGPVTVTREAVKAVDWLTRNPEGTLVLPVNTELRADKTAILGAGLAKAVRDHYAAQGKNLELELGHLIDQVRASGSDPARTLYVSGQAPVVFIPTRVSWRNPTDLDLVRHNLAKLAGAAGRFKQLAVPLIGLEPGNGLTRPEALALTEQLVTFNAVLIDPGFGLPATTPGFVATLPEHIQARLRGKRVLVVTGHRGDRVGGYGLDNQLQLEQFAARVIEAERPDVVVAGGALGIDQAFQYAAEKLGKDLIVMLPCQQFSARWRWTAQERQRFLNNLSYAQARGAVHFVHTQPYSALGSACLQDRNLALLEALRHGADGSVLAAVWDGGDGGTANCLKAYSGMDPKPAPVKNYFQALKASNPLMQAQARIQDLAAVI